MYPNLGHAPIMKSGPCCLHLEFLQLWRNNAFCLQHIFFLFVLVAFLLLLLFLPSPFATLMFVQFSLHKYYSTNLAQIIMPWSCESDVQLQFDWRAQKIEADHDSAQEGQHVSLLYRNSMLCVVHFLAFYRTWSFFHCSIFFIRVFVIVC